MAEITDNKTTLINDTCHVKNGIQLNVYETLKCHKSLIVTDLVLKQHNSLHPPQLFSISCSCGITSGNRKKMFLFET